MKGVASTMFGLEKLMNTKRPVNKTADREQVAKILKTSPEALKKFEEAYAVAPIDENSMFAVNSRNVDKMQASDNTVDVTDIKNRIIDELLAKTTTFEYDGKTVKTHATLPDPNLVPVTNEEIIALPEDLRPQLTGSLMMLQVPERSSDILMQEYSQFTNEKLNSKIRTMNYHMFRQGLDILDYDPIMYAVIDTNPNSMSHWFPALIPAAGMQDFFKLPKTKIIKVPMPMLQLTRIDYGSLTPTTMQIVDEFCYKAFDLDDTQDYFIKTGTYSSKFDFRNTRVTAGKETHELGEYLLFIHQQANNMASSLNGQPIYGVSTTTEWVVREFIEDKDNNPCIYHGMPLHTEYRVFVDFDTKEVIGMNPYWDPDVMKKRFNDSPDSDSPDNIHDGIVYMAHEETLMKRYNENKDIVKNNIQKFIQNINLSGQWSIDIMQNGDDFYIIDMAIAENSAFYECVPPALRHKSVENWLPQID